MGLRRAQNNLRLVESVKGISEILSGVFLDTNTSLSGLTQTLRVEYVAKQVFVSMHQIAGGKARPCERQELGNVSLDYLPVLIGENDLNIWGILHKHLPAVAAG